MKRKKKHINVNKNILRIMRARFFFLLFSHLIRSFIQFSLLLYVSFAFELDVQFR